MRPWYMQVIVLSDVRFRESSKKRHDVVIGLPRVHALVKLVVPAQKLTAGLLNAEQ